MDADVRQLNYNTPSNNRELQHNGTLPQHNLNYNIPSNNRELQPELHLECSLTDYNIPSNNRELQHLVKREVGKGIITYQVITGNYSLFSA